MRVTDGERERTPDDSLSLNPDLGLSRRDGGLTALVDSVVAVGKAALRRPFANRNSRRLVEQVARQVVGGTCAMPVIAGDRYWVVWQGETPFEVYPPLPEGLGPLAERRELQNYQGIRIDPSADSS